MNSKFDSNPNIYFDLGTNYVSSNFLIIKHQKEKMNQLTEVFDKRAIQQFVINLRGGGCGQAKPPQQIEEKKIIGVPENFLNNLKKYVEVINTKAQLLTDNSQRNEVIIACQGIMYNREHLNTCCVNTNLTSSTYQIILDSFGKLLKILPVYLRASWFLCYQILQICNDFLRIIYSFQIQNENRQMDLTMQQEFLQDLEQFQVSLESEETNVWNAGIEYEITLIKIMLINCQTNSEEGKNLLINIVKNSAQSVLSMSPTEDLIPTLIEGAKYLFLQYKDKILYPQEVYATYYLFQTLKWSIVRQLKSQYSVYNQIKQLKDAFLQYILNSDNWIIHFSWISIIVDILAYRPILDKSQIVNDTPIQQQSIWNNLIENKLIISLSYNRQQASIILFQNQVKYFSKEIKNLMEQQGIPKLKLLSEFLLQGQLTQQVNLWNFYKNFSFKRKEETTLKDYEIVLENNDLLLLEKQIERFNCQLDELVLLYQQIQESFVDYFTQSNSTQLNIKLLQDDYSVFEKKILDAYKLALYHLNFIIERSTIQYEKFKLLSPFFEQLTINAKENLQNIFKSIEKSIIDKFQAFQEEFLNQFIIFIEYLSYLSELSLYPQYKKLNDLEKINSKFYKSIHLSTQQNFEKLSIFQQFIINTKEFQQKFAYTMSSMKTNDYNIEIKTDQIQAMSNTICSGKWIQILRQQLITSYLDRLNLCLEDAKSKEDIQQNYINCIFSLKILKLIKQFCYIHEYKINMFYNNMNKEKILAIQEKELINKNFKLTMINYLTQQKEKINCILKQIDANKNSNVSKEKKLLLQQIKSDYMVIQNECDNIVGEGIQELKLQILKFMKEAHLFIAIQNQNQNYNIDAFNNQIKQYDSFVTQIQNNQEEFANSLSQEHKRTFQDWIRKNKHLDFCQFCVDFVLKEIMNTNKLLKLLEQFFVINIDQLKKTDNEDIQEHLDKYNSEKKKILNEINIQTQITKLIEVLKGSNYNGSCECIVQNKQQNEELNKQQQDQNEQQNDEELNKQQQKEKIESTLQETLDFFLIKQQSQEIISQKLEPLYLNVINNLCEQVTIKKSIFDVFDFNNDYKIRECLVYNLIKLQQGIKEEQIQQFSSKLIQYLWIFEKDQRVRNLLKNKELIEMQKLFFSKDIKSMSEQIKQEMRFRMKNIDSIQQELRLEGNSQVKEKLKQQLQLAYDELEQYNDNITEMSEKMDISLIFLKDISKDVKQIKSQIDNLQESLNQVGDDIRKLRGKRYQELLEIRKQKILLQSKLAEVDSVYVQLKTIEYDTFSGVSDNVTITKLMSEQWDDFTGEVNEFIWDQNQRKDVMLLSGNAGSGKSKAARKIEEFIWKQQGSHSKWIPIFVSLPTLKNPKYNLFEQALESENYQFDKYQLREFKDAIQNKQEQIILILDSYDEMKQDCIQQNLIITNKLISDLNIQYNSIQVKIIITTRREILNTLGYQTWFYGDSIRSLKEVKIQDFDDSQKRDYLIQYNELSVKRKIRAVYDFLKSIQSQNFNLDEFLAIWYQVRGEVQQSIENSLQSKSELIFENFQSDQLIKELLEYSPFKYLKTEQITGLRKDLTSIWSVYKFEKAIKNVGISDLLSTPFMLEIIVQVLPNMAKQQQGSVDIKNRFLQSYLSIMNKNSLSKKLQENYKSNLEQSENNQRILSLFDGKQSKIQYDKFIDKSEQQTKINQFLDELESMKFFQTYSITSILKIDGYDLLVDNQTFKIYSQDLECVVQALKMKKYTIFEFYDSFIHYYHDQQIQKLRETGKISNWESFQVDILQFSSNLALEMTINQLSQITYKQKGKLKLSNNYNKYQNEDDWIDEYFNDSQQDLDYNKLIRSCILLSSKGSSYSFTHKSIQEFYVAKYILDQLLQTGNLNNLDQKNTRLMESLYNQAKLNISKDHYKGVLIFIKEKLKNIENLKDTLINIVKLSTDNKFIPAASNSFYLLSQLDVYLGYENFQNINICDTNISGLSFCYSDFSKSKFKNVNINSCNFNYANLTEVEWNDVQCKEKPFLEKKQEITVVKFSQNGKLIASNGEGNLVILWDVENYEQITTLQGHNDIIQSVAFSPNSKTLASASKDKTIKLWDIEKKQLISTLNYHDYGVIDVKFTLDGKKIVSLDDSGILILISCDLDSIKEKPDDIIFQYEEEILVQTCTQDDNWIAMGLSDSRIKLVEVKTKYERDLIGHTGKINALAFSKDGQQLVSACNYLLLLWDLRNDCKCQILSFQEYKIQYLSILNKRQIVIGAENYLAYGEFQYDNKAYFTNIQQSYPVQLFPLSNFAFIVQDQKIEILDLHTQAIINSIIFEEVICEIEFDNDKQRLIITFQGYGHNTRFLDMNTFQEVDLSVRERNTIYFQDLVFEKCNSDILIYDFQNKIIDESNDSDLLFDKEITDFSFQSNLQLLACYYYKYSYFGSSSYFILYDYKEKKFIDNDIQNIESIRKMIFSPIKPVLSIFYDDGSLLFWNFSKPPFECQKFNEIDEGIKIQQVNYSPDGSLLIILTDDQKIRILDEINGSNTKILELQTRNDREPQVSFDNETLCLSDGGPFLWNLIKNEQILLEDQDSYYYNSQYQFSQDGISFTILTKEELILWNKNTGKKIKHYKFPKNSSFENFSFFKDGNSFVTCGKYLQVWKYSENDLKMISAYCPKLNYSQSQFEIKKILLIFNDKYLMYNMNGQLTISDLSKFNLKCIVSTNMRFIKLLSNGYLVLKDYSYYYNNIEIFDWKQLKSIQTLDYKIVEFLQDSLYCIAITSSTIIKMNICSKEEIFKLVICEEINSAKLSQNEKILFLGCNDTIRLLNLEDSSNIYEFALYKNTTLSEFSWSCNNDYICYKPNSDFVIREIKTQQKVKFTILEDGVQQIKSFDSENKILLRNKSGSGIFNLGTQQFEEFKNGYNQSTISYNGQLMAYQNKDAKLEFYDIPNNKSYDFVDWKTVPIQFSKNCEFLYGFQMNSNLIILYSIDEEKKLKRLCSLKLGSEYKGVSINPSFGYISFLQSNILKLKNLNWILKAQMVVIYESLQSGEGTNSFQISQDNTTVIIALKDKYIRKYKLDQIEEQHSNYASQNINCFVEIDNQTICICQENIIQLRDLNNHFSNSTFLGEHEKQVTSLSYSQNTQLLASGSKDQKIFLWNVNAKKKIAVFEGHTDQVNQLSFSPDSKCLASASNDKQIKLWNIDQSEQSKISKGHHKSVNQVAYSKDGLILASCSYDKTIILWDLINKNLIIILKEHTEDVLCLDFSFCSKWLASGSSDESICLWDVKFPHEAALFYKIKEKYLWIDQLQFTPAGHFATISNDRGVQNQKQNKEEEVQKITKIQVWDLSKIGKNDQDFEICEYYTNPICIKDDSFVFQGFNTEIKVYDLQKNETQNLEGHLNEVIMMKSVQFYGDDKLISVDNDGVMIFWQKINRTWVKQSQFKYQQTIYQFDIIRLQYEACIVSMYSDLIIITNLDKMLNCKPCIDGMNNGIQIEKTYLSNSQNFFIVQQCDNETIVLDSVTGQIKYKLTNPHLNYGEKQIKMSNDDKFLAYADNYQFTIFEISEKECQEIQNLEEKVLIFEFSSNDSNILYTVSVDSIIKKLDIKNKSNEIIMELENDFRYSQFSFYFSKHLNYIVYSGYSVSTMLVNLNDKKCYQIPQQDLYGIVTISVNENIVAISTSNFVIYLWNHQKEIVKENNLINNKKALDLTFINDDTELICCQKDQICLFSIQEDLQIILKCLWKINSSFDYIFCPQHFSIFKWAYYQNWQIAFLNSGQIKFLYDGHHKPVNFHSTFSGDYIASISDEGVIIWDLENEKQILNASQLQGNKVMLIEQKTLIIGRDREIKIVDIKNLENIQEIQTISFNEQISLQFSSTKDHFVCGLNTKIKVWRILNDGQCEQIAIYDKEYNSNSNPVISDYGQFLVYKLQKSIKLIRIRQLYTKELNQNNVCFLQYTSDYQNLVTLIDGNPSLFTSTLEQIEIQLDNQLQDMKGVVCLKIASSIDSIFAIACEYCIYITKMIDKKQLTLFRKIEFQEIQNQKIVSLDVNPLGTLLIAGNWAGSIYLWDLTSFNDMNNSEPTLTIENQNDQVFDFSFSSNGIDFSAAIFDGSINLYQVEQINKDENIQQDNKNQENSQVQVIQNVKREFRLICYKSFSRQSLLLANKCIVQKASIKQNEQSICKLFIQKGATGHLQ